MSNKPWVYISAAEMITASNTYTDDYFEDACMVAKSFSLSRVDFIDNLFQTFYTKVDAVFQAEYKKIIGTIHKTQSLNVFFQKTITSNVSVLSDIEDYAYEIRSVAEMITSLTGQYQSLVGQALNFYDLKNTVDFSVLTKDISKELIFIAGITGTVSNESKKSATQMLSIQSEIESLENLNSALNISRTRMIGVMRDLKNRLDEILVHKNIIRAAWYILNVTASGAITIADLSKMTSTEREVFFNV